MSIIAEEHKDQETDACLRALQEVTPYTGQAERIRIRDAIIRGKKNTEARYLEKKARIAEQIRQLQDTLSSGILERDLELQTSRWNSRLNSVVPFIHRLPEDVLCRIFLTTAHSSSRHVPWKGITTVCSQWRKLTLGYPLLWTKPDFYNAGIGKSMARLARSMPLDLSVNTDMCFHNMGAALGYLHSAWRLSLTVDSTPGTIRVNDIFNFAPLIRPAPTLKALEVGFDSLLSPAVLPENLFAGEAPCLRTIYLRQCNLPWTSKFVGSFSSITTLRLRIEAGAQRRLDTTPFHTVMSQLRLLLHLKVLELHDVFSRIESTDTAYFDETPDLVFNNLEQLAIQASSPACELIFAHFDYPSSAAVKISGLFPEDEVEFDDENKYNIKSIRRLLTTVLGKTSSLHSLTIGYLGVKARCRYGGLHHQLKWLTTEQASETRRTKDEKRPYYRIGLPNSPGLLKGIWQSVPMEELKYFRYLLHQSDNDMWETFGSLPNLRSVAISGKHDGFFKMLKSDVGRSSQLSHAHLQKGADLRLGFASMTDLRLFDMKFQKIGYHKNYHTNDQNTLFNDFCALIKERIALASGLEILCLENCDTVEVYQLEQLRHVVKRVEWKDLNKRGKRICRVLI